VRSHHRHQTDPKTFFDRVSALNQMSELYPGKVVLDGGPRLEIAQKAAIDAAKLQAISTIISRKCAKLAQDIEKGMEMRY
jgi:hypothetical protein